MWLPARVQPRSKWQSSSITSPCTRKRKAVALKNGASCRAAESVKEFTGRSEVPGTSCLREQNCSLFYRGVAVDWDFPIAARGFHRVGQGQRQGNDTDIRGTRLHKLGRLRNVFSEHELAPGCPVDAGFLHGADSRTTIRRMFGICDRDPANLGLQKRFHSQGAYIERRILGNP